MSWTGSSKPLWRCESSLGNLRPGTRCVRLKNTYLERAQDGAVRALRLPGQPFGIPDSSLATLSHMALAGDGRGPDHGA
ncbi:hypothetical protein B0T13DRAFT_390778 [Neurospora crassa]|nr:hypothetical protein B0T13DRAFT_390778 [Neurospora crassa]